MPNENGTLIKSAISDDAIVPYTNGNAPNSPLMGSQRWLVKKPNPNCRIESIESEASATTIANTIATIKRATSNTRTRKIASPVFPVGESTRRQVEFVPAKLMFLFSATALIRALSESCSVGRYGIDLCFSSLHDVGRQRRVLQVLRESFAVVNSPPQEIHERFSFRSILLGLVDQDVRVARNRISAGAGGICDRNA